LTTTSEISGGYSRVIKSRLQKKLEMFVNQELPILVEKGYLDVTEFRNVTENRNALVAQLAERGFASYNEQNNRENKSPRWDLNPRPKVSAPPLRDERGITKPSPRKKMAQVGSVTPRS
jgi:hypothetical protein